MTHYKSLACRVLRHLGIRPNSARIEEILSAVDQEILIPGNVKAVVQALDASRNALFRCFRNHYGSENNETAHFWMRDRKSTRLNSSHVAISYAVFCLKKKNQ